MMHAISLNPCKKEDFSVKGCFALSKTLPFMFKLRFLTNTQVEIVKKDLFILI